MQTIEIKEADFVGNILSKISVEVEKEIMTVEDLITLKVSEEVQKYNQKAEKNAQNFIAKEETQLNGRKSKSFIERKKSDTEKEVYKALEAFQQNQIIVLIDNKQAENLADEVILNSSTNISFMQLTPLVGG